ncbi:tRNA:m(4)X modification enzyme TRM13 homolog isoform X2 [Poecile atricapillus]|uniref:tRNA:m(4)X modification enzyme TRM13 homolog isoform X2 n=1 Tax=Poecile atricapillus TaxID=48891 RepID=UPI002738E3BB|nr:tRNA:m(4)X modification enzyme TRM13 homolog isoform X2 [Poecile atricapillus]
MAARGPPGAAMAAPEPEPGRCAHFVLRKGRFCRMIPAPGRRFCGEHGHEEEQNDRKRIPCPLDPKHTVYEDQLQKHLKKCNSREKPKPVYFVQDINAGLKDIIEIPEKKVPLSSLSIEELQNLIIKLKKASNGLELHLKEQILSHQALQEALNDPKNGESAFKHLKQQASILGNMEKLHLLGPGRCFVEFGAGRGKLSHWVDIALENVESVLFLLVERATTRFKVDGKHKKRDSIFERLQVDIQHLCLNKVPILEKKKLPVVGIGKHLCGAATDLALRCLVESYTTCCDGEDEEPAPKRCRAAQTEVAPHKSAGEGSEDQTNDTEEHEETLSRTESGSDTLQGILSVEERKEIGCLCKRLIDHGRIEYLQHQGYKAALQYYTESAVSLENVLLTAVPNPSLIPEPTI